MPVSDRDLAVKRAANARAHRTAKKTGNPADATLAADRAKDYAAAKLERAILETVERFPPLEPSEADRLALLLRDASS